MCAVAGSRCGGHAEDEGVALAARAAQRRRAGPVAPAAQLERERED
jgi:hypothetical protein